MFGEALFAFGVKVRSGFGQDLSEGVATFGLILTIAGAAERARETLAAAAGLYIVAAYWFYHIRPLYNQSGGNAPLTL